MEFERWKNLMHRMRFGINEPTFKRLEKFYGQSFRTYHNLSHISECIRELDFLELDLEIKNPIELALWFHDLIYDPYRKDNELRSAVEAKKFLLSQHQRDSLVEKVYDLILITAHTTKPSNESEKIIVDLDLSILGSDSIVYQEYCKRIRKEYRWVPYFLYKKKRKEVLRNFLERDCIYNTPQFVSQFESKARANLENEVEVLS